MDLTELFLYVLGFFLVIIFLRYVITAQNILGMVLKNPEVKIVDRSDCPGYLRDFYALQEKELVELGFKYLYCMLMDNLFAGEHSSKTYIFVYYHQEEKTYATLSPSDTLDNYLPFRLVFRTYFKNGKRLMTYNCLKHALIGTLPDTILKDAYVETVEKQFTYHLKNITGINEGEIIKFDEQLHPDEFISEEAGFNEKYLKKLVEDGFIYPVDKKRYLVKTISSIRIAHQLLAGLKKVNLLREKIKKLGKQVDLPVELEVENFLTQKFALNQKIRNRVGKFFFLFLSVVFFAAALLLFVPPGFVAVLIGVVFLHESGHLLAMRLFGFKNLRMLFIPLFGAIAMGSDKGVAPHKKVVTFFAGPVPGIVLAFILLFLHFRLNIFILNSPTTITVIILLLFINYLNLIPVLPFDGGQIFNTIIFSRLSILQLLFNVFSFIAIVLLTIFLQAPILIVVALLNLLGVQQYFLRKRFMADFNRDGQDIGSLSEKDLLKKIFLRFKELPIKGYNSLRKFRIAQHIEANLTTRKASKKTVMITVFFYVFLFAAPVLYLFSTLDLTFLKPGATFKDPCKAVRETAKPAEIAVEKSDFKRLDRSKSRGTSLVALKEPVLIRVDELGKMLYVYTAFFAIGHDKWLASEASTLKTGIEVSGLPAGLTAEEQLGLFPHIKKAINSNSPLFKRLNRPRAAMMESGVYPDPKDNRLLLLQGLTYTQDGSWGLVNLLKDSTAENLTALIELEFFPGDYGKAPDLDDYFLCLKGNISGEHMDIRQVSEIVKSPEKIHALLQAARFFAEFEAVKQQEYRYLLEDEEEAKKIKNLYIKVAGRDGEVETNGREIISKNHRAYDLGLVIAFYRYGLHFF